MDTLELKSRLHQYIEGLSDKELLQELYEYLRTTASKNDSFEAEVYSLSKSSGNEVWANEEDLGMKIITITINKASEIPTGG